MHLSESIFNKYSVEKPVLIKTEKISQKHVNIYNKNRHFTILYVNGNYSLLILLFVLNPRDGIVTVYMVD